MKNKRKKEKESKFGITQEALEAASKLGEHINAADVLIKELHGYGADIRCYLNGTPLPPEPRLEIMVLWTWPFER